MALANLDDYLIFIFVLKKNRDGKFRGKKAISCQAYEVRRVQAHARRVWEGKHHGRNHDLRYTLDVRDGYSDKDPIIIIIVELFCLEYSAVQSKEHFDIIWRARA